MHGRELPRRTKNVANETITRDNPPLLHKHRAILALTPGRR
jgi:hypothetical protein